MTSAVRYAIVLHRGLACSDESATDEEQAERVLYFYPESASLSQQLAKVIVLESLIDFSSRFSTQPLDSVVMQNHTWAFSECEPGVWVILGVDAQPHVSSPAEIPVAPVPQSPLPLHCNQASPFALQASAQHIYRLLRLTHGPLLKALRGPAKVGVKQGGQECRGQEAIVRVRGLRKAVRKLRLRLRQESQDAENLRSRQEILAAYEEQGSEAVAEEHMGIRDGDKTLQQAEVEIDTSNQAISHTLLQLAEALKDPHYPLPRLRDALARHLRLQISSGQWDAHCLLQGMQGVRLQGWSSPHPVLSAVLAHTGPQHASSGGGSGGDSRSSEGLDSIGLGTPPVSMAVDTDPLGTPGSGESQDASCTSAGTGGGSGGLPAGLLRLRRLVLDATDELSTGCVILLDGCVAWSDLDAASTALLQETLMLQEARAVRGAVTALLTSHSLGNGTGAEVEASVQRSLNALLTSRGIVCGDWEVVDLADDGAGGGGGNGSGGGGGGGRSDREGVKLFSLVTSARVAGRASLDALLRARADTSTDVTADSCEGMSRIYCPRIYAPVRTSSSGGGVAVCIGRAVIHRHNRVIVVVLLPDWDSEEGSGSSSGGTSGVGGSSSGASGGTSSGVGTSGAQGAHSQGPWGPHFKVSALSEVLQEYGEGQSIDSNNSSNNSINNNNSSNKGDEPLRAASQQIARRLAVMKPQQFIDFLHTCADGREGGGAQLGQACLVTLCASLQLLLGPESARICRLLGGMEQDGGGLLPRGALAAWAVAAAQVQAQAQVQAATQAREGGYGYGPKRLGSIANIGSIGNIGSMGMGIGAGSQSYGGPRRAASYSSTGSGGDLPLDMGPLSLDDSPALSSPLASIGARISHDLGLPSVSAGAPFTGGSLSPPGPSLPARAHSFLSSLAPPTHTPPPSGATPPAPVPKDLSASARSLRYIYHSPAEHTVKVYGVNRADLSLLLSCPAAFHARVLAHLQPAPASSSAEARATPQSRRAATAICRTLTQTPTSLVDSGSSSGGSGGRGAASVNQGFFPFPASAALLAQCLEAPVVRALNDAWERLQPPSSREERGKTGGTGGAFGSEWAQLGDLGDLENLANLGKLGNLGHRAPREVCLRVATAQRGGVWVTGRRLGDRYLYMVVERCATMNEMYATFEHLTELLLFQHP